MRIVHIFIFIVITVTARAQNGTPELITDRPDQTESYVVVPHKFLQVETGFEMENNETELVKQHR